jgi:hypothetical protein
MDFLDWADVSTVSYVTCFGRSKCDGELALTLIILGVIAGFFRLRRSTVQHTDEPAFYTDESFVSWLYDRCG